MNIPQQLTFVLTTFLVLSSTAVAANSRHEVRLADYLTAEMAPDATTAVRCALDECRRTGCSKLVLPGGTLRLRPDEATEKYQFISNNDAGLKRIAFDLEGMSDFTVEGNGTRLLFRGFVSPFSLENCRGVTVENLSVDFERTFHSEGVIAGAGEGWLDIEFPPHYRVDTRGGVLRLRDGEGNIYPFSNLLEFDSRRREPAFMATDYWLPAGSVSARTMENGVVRIFVEGIRGSVGNVMVFGAEARSNPGFFVADSRGVRIRDVDLYHCGGMGVIAQCSSDIELERLRVIPSLGSGRMISIAADATHFVNCSGFIRMTGCVFENQKDDATNIHGLYVAVERVTGPFSALFRLRHPQQRGVDFIREGMKLELVDNADLKTLGHGRVARARRLNSEFWEVTFAEPLPATLKPGHVAAAAGPYPRVLIKGCRMRGNRARGLLLGSRAETVIEDNYFHIAGAAILFEGDGNYWFEQSGVNGVEIRGNTFENCNYGSPSWGAACIAVGSGIPSRQGSRYHRRIVVEGNIFKVFDPRLVSIYCVDGFVFRDNTVERTDDYTYRGSETPSFVYENCDNVKIE